VTWKFSHVQVIAKRWPMCGGKVPKITVICVCYRQPLNKVFFKSFKLLRIKYTRVNI